MGRFVEVCRRGLKFNADKTKVLVLGGRRDLNVRSVRIGDDWSNFQSSNI